MGGRVVLLRTLLLEHQLVIPEGLQDTARIVGPAAEHGRAGFLHLGRNGLGIARTVRQEEQDCSGSHPQTGLAPDGLLTPPIGGWGCIIAGTENPLEKRPNCFRISAAERYK
jgi:hypothetical protein